MKTNKYYTPTIGEVHFGFEYEFHYMVEGWKKERFEKMDFNYLAENIKEELIRVKYLDKEDIESLGFKKTHSDLDFVLKIKNIFTYELRHEIAINGIIIKRKDMSQDTCVFAGTIKNKSELKKLLKQLNIQ